MKITTTTTKLKKGSNKISLNFKDVIYDDIKILIKKGDKKDFMDFDVVGNSISLLVVINDTDTDTEYEIIVKNRNDITVIPLKYSKIEKKGNHTFSSNIVYRNGLVTMCIKPDKLIFEDLDINVMGDFNKVIKWKAGQPSLTLTFPMIIDAEKTVKYYINNTRFAQHLINRSKFPSGFIKVRGGIKLNMACEYELLLVADGENITINPYQQIIAYDWDSTISLKLSYKNNLLFEQTLTCNTNKPELVISNTPLRLRISFPILEKVIVKLEGYDELFIINAGDTQVEIPPRPSMVYTILEASNTNMNKARWIYYEG
jgi:hypothetical protein